MEWNKLFGRPEPSGIESFESVLLRTSGMRGSTEYEAVKQGGKAVVSRYAIRYVDGKDQRVLEDRGTCSEARMLELLNACRLQSWNGFNGKHPKGVLDGMMFRLEAVVNDGEKIVAQGSENFPKHYREFTDGLYSILREGAAR